MVMASRRHDFFDAKGTRRRNLARHRSEARGFVIGALLVTAFFTLPFGRLPGR